MQWLSENWVFLLIAIAFIAMHLFGHGGHGGHGGPREPDEADRRGSAHRH